MSKNESRRERKKRELSSTESKKRLSKVYYWVIGALFIILLLLVGFIFSRAGGKVQLDDEANQETMIQEATKQEESEEKTKETETKQEETEDTDDTEEDADSEEDSEEEPEEETENEGVNENAPYDPDHAVNYEDGSADRIAIKEQVMQVTGLGSDLIELWVGNDGPGRVTADVASADQTEKYQVNLQYGDGKWHVTSYQKVN